MAPLICRHCDPAWSEKFTHSVSCNRALNAQCHTFKQHSYSSLALSSQSYADSLNWHPVINTLRTPVVNREMTSVVQYYNCTSASDQPMGDSSCLGGSGGTNCKGGKHMESRDALYHILSLERGHFIMLS